MQHSEAARRLSDWLSERRVFHEKILVSPYVKEVASIIVDRRHLPELLLPVLKKVAYRIAKEVSSEDRQVGVEIAERSPTPVTSKRDILIKFLPPLPKPKN